MGLLMLTGFVLMPVSGLPRWYRARGWLHAPTACTGAASVVVLILLLLGQLPCGF